MSANCQNNYEGAEKLLEIWFFDETGRCPNNLDLRRIPRDNIHAILDLAQCTIVKEHKNEEQLSFVLSESSLFISRYRIILKTCGNTQLLKTIKPLINCAHKLGFRHHRTYYSHCAFLFPEQQNEIYQDFRSEALSLDQHHKSTEIERTFGQYDKSQWYFYCAQSTSKYLKEPSGQTLELMMRELSPERMKTFYVANTGSPELMTKRSGIKDLFPEANIADYLFEPCGYSVNGVMKSDEYFTIHVTPETEFSYVSVETNEAKENYTDFIMRVLKAFEPGSFICTFVSDSDSKAHGNHEILKNLHLPNYRVTDFHEAEFLTEKKVTYLACNLNGMRNRNQSASSFNSDEDSDSGSWKTD